MKQILAFIFVLVSTSLNCWGLLTQPDFATETDGLAYRILYQGKKSGTVECGTTRAWLSGNIVIPDSVSYDGRI